MPTYEYRCARCGDDLEVYQTFSEDPLKKHAVCGGKLTRVFSPVGIVLKGSGFYKNDKRDSSAPRGKAREETSSNGDSAAASDSKSSESKGSESKGSESQGSESQRTESKGSESRSSSDSSKPAAASEKKSGEPKRDGKKSPVKSG